MCTCRHALARADIWDPYRAPDSACAIVGRLVPIPNNDKTHNPKAAAATKQSRKELPSLLRRLQRPQS
jgi:hypothetical protein